MSAATWDQTIAGVPATWDSPLGAWDRVLADPIQHIMASDNRISETLSAGDKTTILQKVADIRALLPFLLSLPADEREALPKLGDRTLGFDDKCKTYMEMNPTLVPGFVSVAEQVKDRALRDALLDVLRELAPLTQALTDTAMLAGSEAYMGDLAFYQNVRQAARRGIAGAQAIYDDLKTRFPGSGGTPPPPPAPNP